MPLSRPPRPAGPPRASAPDLDLDQQLRDSVTLLRSVRRTLADLLQQVLDGDAGAGTLRDLAARQSDLEAALRRALEAEARWADWEARQGRGADPGAEIDFEALREGIACHLARLRDCCQEG